MRKKLIHRDFLDDLPEDLIVGKSRTGRSIKSRPSESLWAASSRTLKAASVIESKFRAGTHVHHKAWGDGIVLDSKIQDEDEIVDVVFEIGRHQTPFCGVGKSYCYITCHNQ